MGAVVTRWPRDGAGRVVPFSLKYFPRDISLKNTQSNYLYKSTSEIAVISRFDGVIGLGAAKYITELSRSNAMPSV